MSADELRNFLDRTDFRPEDIASDTGLSLTTVYRFLRGGSHSRSTERALAQFVASKTVSPDNPKKATG